jgi:dienelactone hydrolase
MGYCWVRYMRCICHEQVTNMSTWRLQGAQGALHLGAKDTGIASAVGFAHPVISDTLPFESLAKPALFLCCAQDQFFPSERRQAAEQVMFKKADEEGLNSKFVVYPGNSPL